MPTNHPNFHLEILGGWGACIFAIVPRSLPARHWARLLLFAASRCRGEYLEPREPKRVNAANCTGTGRRRNPANKMSRAPWSRWPQNLNVSVPTSNRTGANGPRCFPLRSSRSRVPPRGTVRGGARNGQPRTRSPGPTRDEKQNFKKKFGETIDF